MLINEMMIFYYVVQLKSFSQAAIKLKVSKSHVSKHITCLEKDLKIRLLSRSTRQLALTEEGKIFYQHCENLFKEAKTGYDAIANLRNQPTGTLKISVPPAFALHILNKPLAIFAQANPEVKLNIILETRIEDIIEQGYDLALRSTILPDSNLIAQQIYVGRNILCASPMYLKKNKPLQKPEQLSEHRFAAYSSGKLIYELRFNNKKEQDRIIVEPYLQSNSADFLLQMAISGCCIVLLPEFMIKSALIKQELVECLPQYKVADSTLYAVYPDKNFIPLRVKAFVEQLKTYLSDIEIAKQDVGFL